MADPNESIAATWFNWAGPRIAALLVSLLLLLSGLPRLTEYIARAIERRPVAGSPCEELLGPVRWADRLYRLEGLFPYFTERARQRRLSLLDRVRSELRRCGESGQAIDGQRMEPVLEFSEQVLRDLSRDPQFHTESSRLSHERLLHVFGRNERLLALAETLPPGGNVEFRVAAALYRGDEARAASIWREPGAHVIWAWTSLTLKPAVLCLAGDYEGARSAFETPDAAQGLNNESAERYLLARQAECLLDAGDLEGLRDLAARAPSELARDWQVEIAIEEGDLERARQLNVLRSSEPDNLLLRDLWLQVRTGHLEDLANHPCADRLRTRPLDLDSGFFRTGNWPPLNEPRLLEVAEALATSDDPQLRILASRAFFWRAVRLGQRWDEHFESAIDRAEELDGAWPRLAELRAGIAFFHGDWEAFDAAPPLRALETMKAARALMLGGSGESLEEPSRFALGVGPVLGHLNQLSRLHRSARSPEAQIEALRPVWLQLSELSQFYRLTNLVRHGRLLSLDVGAWQDQLSALRAMHERLPAPRVRSDERPDMMRY